MNPLACLLLLLSLASAPALAQEPRAAALANREAHFVELTTARPEADVALSVSDGNNVAIDVTSSVAVDVTITDPLGRVIPPSALTVVTIAREDAPPLGASFLAQGAHVLYEAANHPAGTWTVTVALPPGTTSAMGQVQAVVEGGMTGTALTAYELYGTSDTPVVGAALVRGGAVVQGAVASADVYTESRRTTPIVADVPLRDDGLPPDAAAGDGMYTAVIGALPVGGYVLEAHATHGASTVTATATFEVRQIGRLTGDVVEVVDRGGDYDGTYVEGVEYKVEVQADGPGTYDVELMLRAWNGETTRAAGSATMTSGRNDVIVKMPVQRLRDDLGVDGPYAIEDIMLVWRASEDPLARRHLVDRIANFGETFPYLMFGDGQGDYDLKRPSAFTIAPGFTEETTDSDGDGLFDRLRVTITWTTVDILWEGLTAELRAADGTTLATAGVLGGFVSPGTYSTTLSFDGAAIGGSRKDGPYQVRNVTIYDNFTGAYVSLLGETQPYSHHQFEDGGALQDNDVDGVPNDLDNCLELYNPDQRDTNSDGYGNLCDPDFDQNCVVQILDAATMKARFFSEDPDADLNGDGRVNFVDLGILKRYIYKPPGPSGLTTRCR
jgi:hypothetical protein